MNEYKFYQIHYCERQLTEAVKFIHSRDYYNRTIDKVREHVMEQVTNFGRRCADVLKANKPVTEWPSWTVSGGLAMIATTDDDESIDIEIFVDPSHGQHLDTPYRYITEEIPHV